MFDVVRTDLSWTTNLEEHMEQSTVCAPIVIAGNKDKSNRFCINIRI